MNKKIIILAESIDKNDSSCSKGNVALIENLKKAGFDITVYDYTRKKIILKDIECHPIKEIKWGVNYLLSRTQRVLQRNLNINFNSFLEQIFGFSFTFFNDVNSMKLVINKIKDLNPDLIITLSKGTSFRPHYAMLSFPDLYDKWLANIHDPYPFHLNPRPFNWVEHGYQKKENFFNKVSHSARYSSFPSLLLKDWMGSYFPSFLKTGIVIPHQNANYEILNHNLPDYFDVTKFNLLHAGNLLAQRSPIGLLDGFELFLNQNPEAKKETQLLLLGPASAHIDFLKKYENNNPNIFIDTGYVDFDIVYHLQTKASVNIILEAKSEISPFLPGKFPHCVEANKAILSLAPYYSETRRLLGNDYEYWSEADDVEKIATLIGKLYQLWKQSPGNLLLNRKDLEEYLSVSYLKKVINGLD
jgi:hypothetical protein